MESFHLRRGLALSLSKGFTLIELLVVMAIIVVITSIVLTNQSTFNKTLVLANTAYDIALTLRSAETYGISSRASNTSINAGYGIRLQSGNSGAFTLFADISPAASCGTPDCKPGDHVYTASDTLVQTYTLGNGIFISNFCVYSAGVPLPLCRTSGLTSLDIVFVRPNPNPFLSANGSYSASYSGACIAVSSPQGGSRYVSIAASGEITANAPSCP